MAKVLVVDDDPVLVRMYRKKLENDGYRVEVAFDGEEALRSATRFRPDLILLDILMPKIDGFEVLRRLKAKRNTRNIPVVILTNIATSEKEVEKGMLLGATAYLIKAESKPKSVIEKMKQIFGN